MVECEHVDEHVEVEQANGVADVRVVRVVLDMVVGGKPLKAGRHVLVYLLKC